MTTAAAATPEPKENKMPSAIWFIVSNELAERFCFYGINSILTLYMVQYLHFGDADATSSQALFKVGAYFFPMMGAIISDALWGKYRTIMVFSTVYMVGCILLAFIGTTPWTMGLSLGLVAVGTGGIKPCVSTNVGDQFSAKNQHLIERAFSWFYMAINLGSSFSIFLCPVLLDNPNWGPKWAFGLPAVMMAAATLTFWSGRRRYVKVPPAGKAWLKEVFSTEGLKLAANLVVIYFFVACFWMLWDQSNGSTWTLQATSGLMNKNIGFGLTLLPAHVQLVNGIFILMLAPLFSYAVYPFLGRFFKVTPLRKIGLGLWVVASSFLIIAWIEDRIQAGHEVSVYWQIAAYLVLTAAEILVSITALEFSYKQAPLRMKSFIMGLFLLSTAAGNVAISAVNKAMQKPLHVRAIEGGAETWVTVDEVKDFVTGQKIDLAGDIGLTVAQGADGKPGPLEGTFLAGEIDANGRMRLMDVKNRAPVVTSGTPSLEKAKVSTYYLVGPIYFLFFAGVMAAMAIVYIFVALAYKERTHVREDAPAAAPEPAGA